MRNRYISTAVTDVCSILLTLVLVLSGSTQLTAQNLNGVLHVNHGRAIIPASAALDITSTLTIEAWVKPSNPVSSYGAIVDKKYASGYSMGVFSIGGLPDEVRPAIIINNTFYYGKTLIKSDSSTWTHLAATVDGGAGVIRFYVDGAQDTAYTVAPFSILTNTSAFSIGASSYGDWFTGSIDEVRIWNTARTTGEISGLKNFEAKGNEAGLVGMWHFDDVRDTVAFSRGLAHDLDGSLSGGAVLVNEVWPSVFIGEYEYNNRYASASMLPIGRDISAATLAAGDTDIYRVYTHPGDVVTIAVHSNAAGSPPPMFLTVAGSDSTQLYTLQSANPTLTIGLSSPGVHYIRLSNADPSASQDYTVRLSLPGTIAPDSREPNNLLAAPTFLQYGDTLTATAFPGVDAGAVCDTDYYAFHADAGDVPLMQEYGINPVGGGLRFNVFTSAGVPVPTSGSTPHFTASAGDDYRIRLVPAYGATPYVLQLAKGLTDIHDFVFDPMYFSYGIAMMDGTRDAYDGMCRLLVGSGAFSALFDYGASELSGRQFVTKPQTINGLTVRRKFFVPTAAMGDTLGFMRIQEILENTTGSPITTDVMIYGDLGSDNMTQVIASSRGSLPPSKGDRWIITDDNAATREDFYDDPTLTQIIDGAGASKAIDTLFVGDTTSTLYSGIISWAWKNVTVNPGEKAIFMYFTAQDSNAAAAQKKAAAFDAGIPSCAFYGLESDASSICNWKVASSGVQQNAQQTPLRYALYQNFPNPFNPTTGVRFQVSGDSKVKLVVYDVLGREVATLVNERKPAGVYEVQFDAHRLSSGVYFYRLTAGDFVAVKSMVVLK